MDIHSTYKCKIKYYNKCLKETVSIYRNAVDFLISVCLKEWERIESINGANRRQRHVEELVHSTKDRMAIYDFDRKFYKYPSYLLRSSITEAIGKVSSYMGNMDNWKNSDPITRGKKPSYPVAGYIYPCMYR